MFFLHIPNAAISTPQTCRFNKQTDNFSQAAKPISAAFYLRNFLLSQYAFNETSLFSV